MDSNIDYSWRIKSATISQDGDGKYYASVLFEGEKDATRSVAIFDDNAIGLDYASSGLYVDDKGSRARKHNR